MIMHAVGNLSKCTDDPVPVGGSALGDNNTTLHNNLSTRVNNVSTSTSKAVTAIGKNVSIKTTTHATPVPCNCGTKLGIF